VILCNAFGSVVRTIEKDFVPGPNFCTIETSDLAEGIYFIQLTSSEGTQSARVVIVH
jgi:hypothetical protein